MPRWSSVLSHLFMQWRIACFLFVCFHNFHATWQNSYKTSVFTKEEKAHVLWLGIYLIHPFRLEKVIKLISVGLICCPDWRYILSWKHVRMWYSSRTVLKDKFMRDWSGWPVISYPALEYCHVVWQWLKRSNRVLHLMDFTLSRLCMKICFMREKYARAMCCE